MSELDEEKVESELRGKTLRVYWFMLRKGNRTIGVREIQRGLGFSSPSIAAHHLEKLRILRLVDKNLTGEYQLVGQVKVGLLKLFVRIGSLMLPRYLFYAIFVTTVLASYLLLYPQRLDPANILALMLGIPIAIILWYETFRIFRDAPF